MNKSQNSEIEGFSYLFCLLMENLDQYKIMMDPDPGGPKRNGSGSTTPASK
jgi:hypothetical protein